VEESEVLFGPCDLDLNRIKGSLVDFQDLIWEDDAEVKRRRADAGNAPRGRGTDRDSHSDEGIGLP
jgi:hypothetical protein